MPVQCVACVREKEQDGMVATIAKYRNLLLLPNTHADFPVYEIRGVSCHVRVKHVDRWWGFVICNRAPERAIMCCQYYSSVDSCVTGLLHVLAHGVLDTFTGHFGLPPSPVHAETAAEIYRALKDTHVKLTCAPCHLCRDMTLCHTNCCGNFVCVPCWVVVAAACPVCLSSSPQPPANIFICHQDDPFGYEPTVAAIPGADVANVAYL